MYSSAIQQFDGSQIEHTGQLSYDVLFSLMANTKERKKMIKCQF